jgi:hypothetical protein
VNTLVNQWTRAGLSSVFLVSTVLANQGAMPQEGVAICIVYDTSGSMQQKVRDSNGQLTPKYLIASRALNAVLDRLQAVAAGPANSKPVIHAGLVVFQGSHASTAIPCRPFDPAPFRAWMREHGQPKRGTPLGEAVGLAGREVLASPLPRKHVLVITDGINTEGPDPTITVPKLQREAAGKQAAVSLHFVAFDVNAAEFSGVKRLGATVVGAADEKQLNTQLEFIIAKKILLEEEEVQPVQVKPN